jgi:hypothetical protein
MKEKTLKPFSLGELVVTYDQIEDIWLRARIIQIVKDFSADDIYEVLYFKLFLI